MKHNKVITLLFICTSSSFNTTLDIIIHLESALSTFSVAFPNPNCQLRICQVHLNIWQVMIFEKLAKFASFLAKLASSRLLSKTRNLPARLFCLLFLSIHLLRQIYSSFTLNNINHIIFFLSSAKKIFHFLQNNTINRTVYDAALFYAFYKVPEAFFIFL